MNDISQLIIEGTASGKIDKKTGVELLKRLVKMEDANPGKDVAIIGIALKFPKASDAEEFWQIIRSGIECAGEYPQSRWKDSEAFLAHYSNMSAEEIQYCQGGYLEEIDKFDYNFFRISPKEASLMDPQQRLFLETAMEAMEDAGYGGKRLAGSKTGIYLGYSTGQIYGHYISKTDPASVSLSITGNVPSVTAGRIAYLMDFKGPSMLLDTACSSSLVAVHMACRGIRNGDCDQAIVGGVNVSMVPAEGIFEIGIESGKKKTCTFDDGSDGALWGEGVAAVLLKPLSKAVKDGDPIYAVIKGSAINQDGTSAGLTAPNAMAQAEVIVNAWKDAGINPETISYIEAHGTGTKLGDPIEIDGLQKAFRRFTDKKQICAIGSVKANIGHTECAAGIAGLIKAALALKNQLLPPSINFSRPNRKINFVHSPIFVNTGLSKWERKGSPRRCGVSAFGFSGTNCHVVLEEAPERNEVVSNIKGIPRVFTLSAKSREAMNALIDRYQKFAEEHEGLNIDSMCCTSNIGRGHYNYRLAMIVTSEKDFREKLEKISSITPDNIDTHGIYYGSHKLVGDHKEAVESDELTEIMLREISEAAASRINAYVSMETKDISILEEICRLYVKGASLEWPELYKSEKIPVSRLPVYPFERNRCWVDTPDSHRPVEETAKDRYLEKVETSEASAHDRNPGLKKRQKRQEALSRNTDAILLFKAKLAGRPDGCYSAAEEVVGSIWAAVLGLEEIDIFDSIFELGGDSIIAMRVANITSIKIGYKVEVSQVLKNPSVKALAEYIEQDGIHQKRGENTYLSIQPVEEKAYYAVSSAQKRTYLLNHIDENQTTYNIPNITLVEGNLDIQQVREAFKEVVHRHEVLRTSFQMIDGQCVQIVHRHVDFEVDYMEFGGAKNISDKEMDFIIQNDLKAFVQPFELGKAPLLRVKVIKLSEDRYAILFDTHHIISDGMSMEILTNEFISLYGGQKLPELRLQYKDFSEWQYQLVNSGALKKQEAYWLDRFNGEIPVLNLPTDYTRPSYQSFEGDKISFEVGEEITKGLDVLATNTGTTKYMVLLAAFNVLLHKFSGQEDIVVASPIAGRQHEDLNNLIGMFINTLAMRNNPEGNKTFNQFLTEVKENALKAYENQDYQFEELVDHIDVRRDLSRNPLCDVMFTVQNVSRGGVEIHGLKFRPYEVQSTISTFDLILTGFETDKDTLFDMQYCTRLFKKETVERICQCFIGILAEIAANPELKLNEIDMVSEEEKHKICEFNNTKAEYQKDKTVHELFEKQVDKTPEHIAAVFDGRQITYRELNKKANQLAAKLREMGVTRDCIIGIMVNRSIELLIGILGILKAGGAYVPIDPGYPEERIGYMLEDSSAGILLSQTPLLEKVQFMGEIIDLNHEGTYLGEGANLENSNNPRDLLYLIYTSGTTGRPKGVMLEHRNLVNLISYEYSKPNINYGDKVSQFTMISFDVCYQEIFSALLAGGTLYIVEEEIKKDAVKLFKYIEDHQISIVFLPTAFLKLIFNEEEYLKRFPTSVKHLITAGEQLVIGDSFKKFLKGQAVQLHNHYGPSETHVATTFAIDVNSEIPGIPPIGKPISNTGIYILESSRKLQPIGVAGELYISGDCVGRGYMNRPDLTAEKFLENPFIPGERMYRTGDLARWLSDGNIEFIGRIDHQVKIRGFRIELGEIETELLKHDEIKEAVVIAREDGAGSKYLCAYIVSDRELTAASIREFLSNYLPDYMVPTAILRLDKIPLTPNGKLDRKALPEPDENINTGLIYEAPVNIVEAKLVDLWKEILGIEKFGVTHNFFDLGGHSLKAAMLVSKILKAFNVEVPLREVFRIQTIRGLAKFIKDSVTSIFSSIKPAEKQEFYPLSPAQKRVYLISLMEGASTSYNIPSVMVIEGMLDKKRFEKAFKTLVERHETLRTSFELVGGEPVQRIHQQALLEINYLESEEDSVRDVVQKMILPFDLSKVPLLRVGLIRLSESKHILVYDMHHIISDGISMTVIVNELAAVYSGQVLPGLRIQYKDFAVWQKGIIGSENYKKQEEYWLSRFTGETPVLKLPADYPRPDVRSPEGDAITSVIDKETMQQVYALAKDAGATLYMVLLAVYSVLLMKYTGQEDIVIGSLVAGRPHADLENIVGMFVNTLPIRSYPRGDTKFGEFLAEIKQNLLDAYENQDYPLDELVAKLNLNADAARSQLVNTVLVLQNMESKKLEIDDLKIYPYDFKNKISKFDILIDALETDNGINLKLEYYTKLFKKETMERLLEHYFRILKWVVYNHDCYIKEIPLLDDGEKNIIVEEILEAKRNIERDFDF